MGRRVAQVTKTTLQVRLQPGAHENKLLGFQDGVLRVRVTAPPEHGAANVAVIALLAEALGVAKSRIYLARGAARRSKTFEVDGLDQAEAEGRLASTPPAAPSS